MVLPSSRATALWRYPDFRNVCLLRRQGERALVRLRFLGTLSGRMSKVLKLGRREPHHPVAAERYLPSRLRPEALLTQLNPNPRGSKLIPSGMNRPIGHRRLIYVIAFTLGMGSVLLGNHLERLAEERYFSLISLEPGAIDRCSWIAPIVMVLGGVVVSVFASVSFRIQESAAGSRIFLKQFAAALLSFFAGLIAGGTLIPVR